jgi:hypothetical protein
VIEFTGPGPMMSAGRSVRAVWLGRTAETVDVLPDQAPWAAAVPGDCGTSIVCQPMRQEQDWFGGP